ncbi:MAG: hypothetical protein GXY35_06220 [Chlamydiae bacterium]|nr:hypothetical protein [Chlamydiota bacterium]
MRKVTAAVTACALLASLAGCALVSDKKKRDEKGEKRRIKVLGVPVWKSEKPAPRPSM